MKRFIALLLVIFVCISLTACCFDYEEVDTEQIEEYGFVKIKTFGVYGEGGCYLAYDPATNVEYLVTTGSYGEFSLCPYYNEQGNVAIYEGN